MTTTIADSGRFRYSALHVEDISTARAHQPANKAIHDLKSVGKNLDDKDVIVSPQLLMKGFRLGYGSWISIQYEPGGAIISRNALRNNAVYDVVTHQVARVHACFSGLSKECLAGDIVPQH